MIVHLTLGRPVAPCWCRENVRTIGQIPALRWDREQSYQLFYVYLRISSKFRKNGGIKNYWDLFC